MKYWNLLEQVSTDVSGLTTSADIVYLPSQFRKTVKPALQNLMRKKKKDKLGIQILDKVTDSNLNVLVDGELKIQVPRMYWSDFRRRFKWLFEDGHKIALKEAVEEEIEIDLLTLKKELDDMWDKEPLRSLDDEIQYVRRLFKMVYIPSKEKSVFDYRIYDEQVPKFINKVKAVYKDDRGRIEMLISAIHNRRPLAEFISELYPGVESFMTVALRSEYNKVVLLFTAKIDLNWVKIDKMQLSDDRVLDELSAYKIFKVTKDTVYPRAKGFTPFMLKKIKEVIDEVVEE